MTQVEIRLPELGGGSQQEQLQKMQHYLYTLASQLQFALDGVSREQEQMASRMEQSQTRQEADQVNAIKSLLIRSAEVTEKLSDRIERRLAGKYVAQSQFGTFTQLTEQLISASSDSLRQEFSNVQQISSDLEEVRDSVQAVCASIRTGLLYYRDNGEPVYGVEIGQQEQRDGVLQFHRFARLTAEKLSFFDSNDVEVAYISDSRLHVTGADVASITASDAALDRLRMGDYSWELGSDGHLSLR